jgi:hypothetical protein
MCVCVWGGGGRGGGGTWFMFDYVSINRTYIICAFSLSDTWFMFDYVSINRNYIICVFSLSEIHGNTHYFIFLPIIYKKIKIYNN